MIDRAAKNHVNAKREEASEFPAWCAPSRRGLYAVMARPAFASAKIIPRSLLGPPASSPDAYQCDFNLGTGRRNVLDELLPFWVTRKLFISAY